MAVLAETTAQVLVSDTITLPQPTEKVDEIEASTTDLECFVINDKVNFQGTLHKEIIFVDLEGFVRYVSVDIPFSGILDIPGVLAGQSCQLTPSITDLDFRLLSPTLLSESVTIKMGVKVTDAWNNNITFTNILAQTPLSFGEPNTIRFNSQGILST